jgi:hypothetical protein
LIKLNPTTMNEQLMIFIGVAIIFGIIALVSFYFSKKAIIKRKLKDAVGMKISDFVSGDIAKVVGKVEYVGEPLIAPLSGRRCAYYTVLVEQHVSSGKNSHWKTIIEEEVAGSFVIRDGRHCAHINSDNVKSYLVEDRQYSSGFAEDTPAVLEKYLNAHGQESEGVFGINKTIRYKEGVLEEGELIAAVGRGEWKNADQEQLPDTYDRVLAITSIDKEPVYLSDDPETVRTTYSDTNL